MNNLCCCETAECDGSWKDIPELANVLSQPTNISFNPTTYDITDDTPFEGDIIVYYPGAAYSSPTETGLCTPRNTIIEDNKVEYPLKYIYCANMNLGAGFTLKDNEYIVENYVKDCDFSNHDIVVDCSTYSHPPASPCAATFNSEQAKACTGEGYTEYYDTYIVHGGNTYVSLVTADQDACELWLSLYGDVYTDGVAYYPWHYWNYLPSDRWYRCDFPPGGPFLTEVSSPCLTGVGFEDFCNKAWRSSSAVEYLFTFDANLKKFTASANYGLNFAQTDNDMPYRSGWGTKLSLKHYKNPYIRPDGTLFDGDGGDEDYEEIHLAASIQHGIGKKFYNGVQEPGQDGIYYRYWVRKDGSTIFGDQSTSFFLGFNSPSLQNINLSIKTETDYINPATSITLKKISFLINGTVVAVFNILDEAGNGYKILMGKDCLWSAKSSTNFNPEMIYNTGMPNVFSGATLKNSELTRIDINNWDPFSQLPPPKALLTPTGAGCNLANYCDLDIQCTHGPINFTYVN